MEYKRRTATGMARQSRASTLGMLEEVVATTATIVDSVGEMMYERLYINFAESLEGGQFDGDPGKAAVVDVEATDRAA